MKHRSKKPFIKKFTFNNDYYIFDVTSTRIVKVNNMEYDLIDHIFTSKKDKVISKYKNKYGEDQIDAKLTELRECSEKFNIFKTNCIEKVSNGFTSPDYTEEVYKEHQCRQLVLQLTTDCNLKCKYCTVESDFNCADEEKEMSFETASEVV